MRPTHARIYLSHLRSNIVIVRQLSNRPICAAVKANGYGHGMVEMARLLQKEGVAALGVATVGEGIALRRAAFQGIIMLYSLTEPAEFSEIIAHNLQPFVGSQAMCQQLAQVARKRQQQVAVHLKIDSGMGRIGCTPSQADTLLEYINSTPELQLAGIATHYADSIDRDFTIFQQDRFQQALPEAMLQNRPPVLHAANSGAIIAQHVDLMQMVRPGIMLYGYHPDAGQRAPPGIQPVMELRSRIVFIKRVKPGDPISYGSTWRSPRATIIATLPVGYGDGIPRLLSNNGYGIVHSQGTRYLAPIVGRVCMDQLMIDVGHIPQVGYDSVTLFGPGTPRLDASDLALQCGTIAYEILTAISARVPRIYVEVDYTIESD